MRARSSLKPVLLMLRASAALALTATPLHLSFDGVGPKLTVASALADSDHSGSGGGDDGGGGGRDSGGSDSSGHGGGDDDDGGGDDHSGPGGGGNDDDNGGDDHGGRDGGGGGRGGNDDADDDEDHHVNRVTGDRVEVDGNNIEVIHPDGTKEEIENGRFEMKDARGRTIIERRATRADVNRLMALAR